MSSGKKATAKRVISGGFFMWATARMKIRGHRLGSDETQVMNSNSTSGVQDPHFLHKKTRL